jgi:hypothetical protein
VTEPDGVKYMPTTSAYYLTDKNKWQAFKGIHQHDPGQKGNKSKHSERVAYDAVQGKSPRKVYLFVTDDFPCEECTKYFVALSSSASQTNFILKCTANRLVCAAECGFIKPGDPDAQKKDLSGVLYISNGKIESPNKIITNTTANANFKVTCNNVIVGPTIVADIFRHLPNYDGLA